MRVRIDKGKGFRGYLAENNKTYISILGMRIDIAAR
jgi:putative component of toxin-antitoxin plasmid stabilization module